MRLRAAGYYPSPSKTLYRYRCIISPDYGGADDDTLRAKVGGNVARSVYYHAYASR